MAATTTGFSFYTNVNNLANDPFFRVEVETSTGQPIIVTVRERESFEMVARFILPPGAGQSIGQAFMLADTMKQTEMQQNLMGGGE